MAGGPPKIESREDDRQCKRDLRRLNNPARVSRREGHKRGDKLIRSFRGAALVCRRARVTSAATNQSGAPERPDLPMRQALSSIASINPRESTVMATRLVLMNRNGSNQFCGSRAAMINGGSILPYPRVAPSTPRSRNGANCFEAVIAQFK